MKRSEYKACIPLATYRSQLVNAQVRLNRDKKGGQKGGYFKDPDIRKSARRVRIF